MINYAYNKLDRMDNTTEATMMLMQDEMKQLHSKLLIYETTVQNGVLGEVGTPKPKVKVPNLKEFNSSRTGQAAENFMWGLQQYFLGMGIADDATKIDIVSTWTGSNINSLVSRTEKKQ
ncbi:hypothetical protein GQ457_13G019730 [Hibiscus cannabinus]